MLSKETQETIVPAMGLLRDTPDGQLIMEYLKAVFLYPSKSMQSHLHDICEGQEPSNDERLGHMRVILHMMALLDQ